MPSHPSRPPRIDWYEILLILVVLAVLAAYAGLWFLPQWYWRASLVGYTFLGLSLLCVLIKVIMLRNADGIIGALIIGFAVDGVLLCLPYYLT